MDFEPLDRYLLTGSPAKEELLRLLVAAGPPLPAAAPFLEGMRLLGARTPDLTLLALRLVIAGKRADDDSVTALRELSERARHGGDDGRAAAEAFAALLSER